GAGHQAHPRRAALADQPATGLRVSPALRLRTGALQERAATAAARGRPARSRLPLSAGVPTRAPTPSFHWSPNAMNPIDSDNSDNTQPWQWPEPEWRRRVNQGRA